MINKLQQYRLEIISLGFYLIALVIAEYSIAFNNLLLGMIIVSILIFVLLTHSSMTRSESMSYLLRSMTAIPVVIIIGLSMSLIPVPELFQLILVAITIFAISYTLIKAQGLTIKDAGLNSNHILVQILVASTGILFGIVEYHILEPQLLITTLNIQSLIIGSIILIITTGFAEELLFRGIIQQNAQNALGAVSGILYVALLSAALNIGQNSFLDLIFVFLVGIFYGYIFYKTRSIVGISLAHGISNMFLLLIIPLIPSLLLF